MGPKKSGGKQSSISVPIKSSASADLLIKKKEPDNPEDNMNLSDEVDRDTLAENVGSQDVGCSDEPETASLASVPRTERERSDSETSSEGHKDLGDDNKPIESDEEIEAFDPDPLNSPELVGFDPTSLEQRVRNSVLLNQRFLVSRFRHDEVIELIKAYISGK